ncbi:MAG: hypothetical protein K5897_02335 [Eubacterium sp.]|nr:hypothetical protein [Eubacterium sp.]
MIHISPNDTRMEYCRLEDYYYNTHFGDKNIHYICGGDFFVRNSCPSAESTGSCEEFHVTLLAANTVGLLNILRIRELGRIDHSGGPAAQEHALIPLYDWKDILANREGLVIVQTLNWLSVQRISNLSKEERALWLKERFQEADFVRIRPMSLLPEEGKLFPMRPDQTPVPAEATDLLIQTQLEAVQILESQGKIVIAEPGTVCIDEEFLLDYGYLGEPLAEKIVLKNPHKLEAMLPHFEIKKKMQEQSVTSND